MNRCPRCGNTKIFGKTKCPRCGVDFSVYASAEQDAGQNFDSDKRRISTGYLSIESISDVTSSMMCSAHEYMQKEVIPKTDTKEAKTVKKFLSIFSALIFIFVIYAILQVIIPIIMVIFMALQDGGTSYDYDSNESVMYEYDSAIDDYNEYPDLSEFEDD